MRERQTSEAGPVEPRGREGGHEDSVEDAIEKVNEALFKLVRRHEEDFRRIATRVGPMGDTGVNLAEVQFEGSHYLLMKVPLASLECLTARQREIALCTASGLSNKDVGRRLDIRPATVAAHLRIIYKKLRVGSRSGLLLRLFSARDPSN